MPIYKYQTKSGITKYRIEFYYKLDGKNIQARKKGFNSEREAKKYQTRFLIQLENKEQQQKLTFEQLYNYFIEDKLRRVKETTVKTTQYAIETHVLDTFRNKNIYDITTNDIREWHNTILDKNFSDNYTKKLHVNFSEILNYAVKFFNLNYNVLTKVGLPPKRNQKFKEMQIYTNEEFKLFSSIIDNTTYKTFFEVLYWTGLRKGEALALTWKDIDFKSKTIKVTKTLAYVQGRGRYTTSPKNKASIRTILIDKKLISLLKKLKNEHKKISGYNENFIVFGGNKYLGNETIRNHKTEYAKLAKVKNIRIHDFRHSHASWLINNGANIALVAKRLGHKDTQMTLNTYTHLFPNKEQEILDLIED